MLNPQQIKKALIKLAEFQKRPPYDVCVVRDIIANFDTHPLKEAVLYFCEVSPKEYTARLAELSQLCRSNAVVQLITDKTGIDVKSILDGDVHINNGTWLQLKKHFDYIDDAINNRDKLKEEFEHECSYDLFLSAYIKDCGFSWAKKKYTGQNSDIVNKAWLSFQDFKGVGK